jgi:hypothetical protein
MLAVAGDLLGSTGSYRRARHVLALSLAPLALSLVTVWPLRIAVLGGDVFRSGGRDSGTTGAVFTWLSLAFAGWALALLLIGVRTVHDWSWARSLATTALAAAIPTVLVVLFRL